MCQALHWEMWCLILENQTWFHVEHIFFLSCQIAVQWKFDWILSKKWACKPFCQTWWMKYLLHNLLCLKCLTSQPAWIVARFWRLNRKWWACHTGICKSPGTPFFWGFDQGHPFDDLGNPGKFYETPMIWRSLELGLPGDLRCKQCLCIFLYRALVLSRFSILLFLRHRMVMYWKVAFWVVFVVRNWHPNIIFCETFLAAHMFCILNSMVTCFGHKGILF